METTAPVITSGLEATRLAEVSTMLSPRFYTTDFDAMNRMDVSLVRAEWDKLMLEFEGDNNVDHFKRTPEFASEIRDLPDPLQREFLDFLISSVTSEFSGCVLYKEIEKNVTNPDIKKLMHYMARDESRHAGFINMSLKDFGVAVDLGFLKRSTPTSGRSSSCTRPICRKRSATPATSRSSASSSAIPNTGSTRSSSGSSAGAMTSSGTAKRSRS